MSRFAWIGSLCLLILCSILPGHLRAEQGRDRSGAIITAQNGGASVSRVRAANETTQGGTDKALSDAETDALKRGASIAFVVLASCTLILFILGCGSRVVVFADAADVFMSASIFIAPVVTALATGLLLWGLSPDPHHAYASIWEGAKDNPAPTFAFGAGVLWWAWAIIGTLVSSIRHSGLIVGFVIALLKVGAIGSLLLVWWGILMNYDRTDSIEATTSKIFLLGILAWFGSKFVNGERVMYRRSLMHVRDQSLVQA